MYERVLVPFDGSEPSRRALREAIKIASQGTATLHLLHIVDEFLLGSPPDASYISSSYYADAIAALQTSGRRILSDAEQMAREADLSLESTLLETVGTRVADLIVQKATEWQADLIVMGTHGRRGWRRIVLGSDAEWVLRSATTPVLFVRGSNEAA